MKPSSAKAKGRKFQQWVRDQLLERFPSLEPDDIRSTSMGAGGEDILLSPSARKLIPYSIECKHRKSFAIYSVLEQSESNSLTATPIAVVKGNQKPALVILYAEDFFDLIKEDTA